MANLQYILYRLGFDNLKQPQAECNTPKFLPSFLPFILFKNISKVSSILSMFPQVPCVDNNTVHPVMDIGMRALSKNNEKNRKTVNIRAIHTSYGLKKKKLVTADFLGLQQAFSIHQSNTNGILCKFLKDYCILALRASVRPNLKPIATMQRYVRS